jgi:hypothetical protein
LTTFELALDVEIGLPYSYGMAAGERDRYTMFEVRT